MLMSAARRELTFVHMGLTIYFVSCGLEDDGLYLRGLKSEYTMRITFMNKALVLGRTEIEVSRRS